MSIVCDGSPSLARKKWNFKGAELQNKMEIGKYVKGDREKESRIKIID